MRKYRGIWKLMDGQRVRFELHRKGGLMVLRAGKKNPKTVSFQQLLDVADGQLKMNLV
jgi:hypothetical protein